MSGLRALGCILDPRSIPVLRVCRLGLGVWGLGFRAKGSGFRGFGFTVQGLGFWEKGFGGVLWVKLGRKGQQSSPL